MVRLVAHGVAVEVPRGWEGRILRRAASNPAEQARTVMHVASFPLPEERGDFGVGVTELMRSGDVFVSLFEYGPESVGQPLFAAQGVPHLTADLFSPRRLQRTLSGQVGCQMFFTASKRPFCLYVVIAGRIHVRTLVTELNTMLQQLDLAS
jgi:hypothetical protein